MRQFTHDQYAALNHREGMGEFGTRPPNVEAWVPDHDARRLSAYRIFSAFLDNVTRYYLPEVLWQRPTKILTQDPMAREVEVGKAPAEKYREYGDADLLVEQAVALLLGESQELVVPDAAPLPDDAESEATARQVRAAEFNDWLQQWADDERLFLKLFEQETETVALGDGVLVLGWDADAERPRLRKYDAESYFPVLSGDQDVDEFPNRVHFAWVEDQPDASKLLHRLTYTRRQFPDGATHSYAYSDKPSRWEVVQTHAVWDLKRVREVDGIYDLSEQAAVFLTTPDGQEIRDLPTGVDFMPIVHIPNTPAGAQHFGRSLLLSVAQLLDDIGFADSDLAVASELVGNTPTVLTGAGGAAPLDRAPGAEWRLPAGGDAKLLDTSNTLTAQMSYTERLRQLLSVNSRMSEAILGRVKPNEVPSGFAFQLGFAPTRSLIGLMRLVRAAKHPLIPKFAMRLAQVNGALPAGETPRAEIALGPFMPADVAAVIDQVKALLGSTAGGQAISTRTAVQMLMNAGLPIDDAEDEVGRIQAESFQQAIELLAATGNEQDVLDYLGIDRTAPATPPTPPTPPAPPTPPVQ